jgi:preprotein translocase subunit SecA
LIEKHMDPNTGANERGLTTTSAIPDEERAALPTSALPAGWDRTSRNAPCPCQSGKKFKHCHGVLV